MSYDKGELTSSWEIEAVRTREDDRRDYERELAGIDIGRDARFHGTEFVEERRQGRSNSSNSQRSAQQQYASRLQMLLATNPGYAKLYNDTMGALGDAEDATDRAIAKAEAALKGARDKLDETLSRAATLPDGTRIFKDQWGQVWNEHGHRLSEADSAAIAWRSDLSSYEAYVEDRDAVASSVTRLEVLQGYRVDTLGGIRDRMMDQDNPVSSGEFEQFGRDLGEDAPPEVRQELAVKQSAIPAQASAANLDVPTL